MGARRYAVPWLLLGFGLMGGVSLTVIKYFKSDRTSECKSQITTEVPATTELTEMTVYQFGVMQRLRLVARFLYLCYLFTPAVTLYLLSWLFSNATMANKSWNYTLSALQASGPAFIKLGQWASTRRDLFPNEFCVVVSDLHLHCLPHAWEDTERLMEASFGPKWQQTVSIEDHTPIGSGCVAQVYQGRLYRCGNGPSGSARSVSGSVREAISDTSVASGGGSVVGVASGNGSVASGDGSMVSAASGNGSVVRVTSGDGSVVRIDGEVVAPTGGEPVAVKVLHPNIVQRMEEDISLMKYVASWIDTLYPAVYWVALTECVDEFAIIMEKQVS